MKLYDVLRKEQAQHRGKKMPAREIAPPEYEPFSTEIPEKKFSWKKVAVIGMAFSFVALIYIIGTRLVHAQVVITERHIPFSIDSVALELTHETATDDGRLSFQAMVVTTEVTREVFGSELVQSFSKANGKVVILNEYSKTPQTIKAGTVFTAPTGKRYVTAATVVVPGYTGTASAKTAGTVTATVTAAEAGESYNTESTTFTIAGWTGTKAKQFNARSVGSISGGEAGIRHSLSASEKAAAIATLQTQLIERLKRESRAQIPDNLITFPELQVATIDIASLKVEGQGIKFPMKLSGTMTSYLIQRDLLEQAIAQKAISDRSYPHVAIPALGDITVTPITPLPTNSAHVPENITISLSGDGTIITKVQTETVRESLAGINRRQFNTIFADIHEVDVAKYTLYPFWAPYFPVASSRITVEVK